MTTENTDLREVQSYATSYAARKPYHYQLCLHQLFEAQVALSPDAVALVYEEECITYRELNRHANALAYHLQKLGVRPESCVGICTERSLEMIAGLLGILKAGGAYVPLDPEYPQERLAYLLQDAEVPVLLTQQKLLARLPECGAKVVLLDELAGVSTLRDDQNSCLASAVESLAYIIYTSGSTGQPKGAMITHRTIVARIAAFLPLFGQLALQRQLCFVSLSFDISVEEIFPVLCSGGTLFIHPAPAQESTQDFLTRCRKFAITKLNMPAAYWHQIVNDLRLFQQSVPPSLQLLVTGGESPSLVRLRDWYSRMLEPSRFINVWGTTETTIFASAYEAPTEKQALQDLTVLPVGRPIADTQLYILDAQLAPVPVLTAGELYIGGAGVGRGYLRRPELTAASFVPDPFSSERGARLYKTGDIGRYLPDGNIEFLGRTDQQVKIRGFRVELGEIATVLEHHPALRDVAVVIREDQPSDKRIIAYAVLQHGASPQVAELQQYIRERLPDYMVPASIIFLQTLPLTPNGKIDYRALPAPTLFAGGSEQSYGEARTPLEQALLKLCATILDREQLGIYDNFFDHGAHSLHVTQIASRVRQTFQVELSVQAILETPYVAGLFEHIEKIQQATQQTRTVWNPLVMLQATGTFPPVFLIHPGSGSVLAYTHMVRSLSCDRPFYGLQAAGLAGEHKPYTDLQKLATSYITAISSVQPHGPYWLIGWSIGGAIAFEMAQQLRRSGEQIALLTLIDSSAFHYFYHPEMHPTDDVSVMRNLLQDLSARLRKKSPISLDNVRYLNTEVQVRALVEQAKEEGVLASSISLAELQQRARVFKANIQVVSTYQPDIYEGDMLLIRAQAGSQTTCTDPTLGWKALVRGHIHILDVPGDHYTMFEPPNVQTLAQTLKAYL